MTLHTLFYTIVSRRISDWQRKARRNLEDATDTLPERDDGSATDPTCRLDAQRAVQLLSILSDRERRVFRLHFFEGLSTGEIARRTGIREGTVCYDLSHGRKLLREAMSR